MMIALLQCHSRFSISLDLSSRIEPRFPFISGAKPFGKSPNSRNRKTLRRSGLRDGGGGDGRPVREPGFFDENGAVEDMDSYLNQLSLEYDSVWDTKPSWCQPWTIALTGTGIIMGSWLILNSVVVTSIVATLIGLWWYIFLFSYPKAYSDMIAERRKKIASGQEDTYGIKTEQ